MQMTEMELLHIGDQLNSEALAIAKCVTSASQTTDPKLQQLYSTIADRHRGHYETLLRNVQNLATQRQF
ncbi:MAG: hypothetical protein A4E53_04093 [Pelotomaculum sp. PtaB.Bin104]|nr:MAG: hypothetical protein A4E53_04093 [Pelotomaculum sp. PtaB.Bin104]